mmetsp:Transcript_28320/g.51114  ORF Transcript_28320/g.51114 Transcript_28320/m.51114 type:complete len:266 (-) Transcript_28320:681-1478(-)
MLKISNLQSSDTRRNFSSFLLVIFFHLIEVRSRALQPVPPTVLHILRTLQVGEAHGITKFLARRLVFPPANLLCIRCVQICIFEEVSRTGVGQGILQQYLALSQFVHLVFHIHRVVKQSFTPQLFIPTVRAKDIVRRSFSRSPRRLLGTSGWRSPLWIFTCFLFILCICILLRCVLCGPCWLCILGSILILLAGHRLLHSSQEHAFSSRLTCHCLSKAARQQCCLLRKILTFHQIASHFRSQFLKLVLINLLGASWLQRLFRIPS